MPSRRARRGIRQPRCGAARYTRVDRLAQRTGDRAPAFTLPAADHEGTVSLADYSGRIPLLLGLFRGIYCPFCRRVIVRMGQASERLGTEGVEALAIVATTTENARLYFRFRPPKLPVAADRDFITHGLYGVPAPRRSDIEEAYRTTRVNPSGELPSPLPVREASAALSRLEGFEPTPTDREAREGLAGLGKFPTDEELLTAVRALPR
jgi:peroxiredoxin